MYAKNHFDLISFLSGNTFSKIFLMVEMCAHVNSSADNNNIRRGKRTYVYTS